MTTKKRWGALLVGLSMVAGCGPQHQAADGTETSSGVRLVGGVFEPPALEPVLTPASTPVATIDLPLLKSGAVAIRQPRPPAGDWLAALRARPDIAALPEDRRAELDRLFTASRARVDVAVTPGAGAVTRLRGDFPGTGGDPESAARNFLKEFASGFGVDPGQLVVTGLEPATGGVQVRLAQMVNGVPAFGSGVTVTIGGDGGPITDVCSHATIVSETPGRPAIPESAAAVIAAKAIGVLDPKLMGPGRLVVFNAARMTITPGPGARLAWLFEVPAPGGTTRVFVDAGNGQMLLQYFASTDDDTVSRECPSTPLPYYHMNDATGVPDFVTFPGGLWIPEISTGDAAQVALGFFKRRPLVFGTGDVPNQLVVKTVDREKTAPFGTHVVLQQMYGGLPMFGAELRVHMDAGLSITSIGGRYVRDPRVVPVAQVSEFAAGQTAIYAVRAARQAQGVAEDPAPELTPMGLYVYPTVLSKPGAKNAVAWRFRFEDVEVFVGDSSGESPGQVVAVLPLRSSADRMVMDAGGAGQVSFPLLVERNGVPTGAAALNADASVADPFILATLGALTKLGRASFDDRDTEVTAVTNTNLSLTGGCFARAQWDVVRGWMWFCPGELVGDTMAHELTHGISWLTAGFLPIDEPGALNEHYSDVFGALIFPDAPGVWRIGESSMGGMLRDMITQPPAGYWGLVPRGAGCTAPEDVFKPSCDGGRVHTNCAIGNHAAVFLADGDGVAGSPHTGIGPDRLGSLYLGTLTHRMHPHSTYIDERLNTWQAARDLAAFGVQVVDSTAPGGTLIPFNQFVVDEVSWAFTQVGVDPRLIAGWFAGGGGLAGGKGTLTFFENQSLPACFLVGDVELQIRVYDPFGWGLPWWSGSSRVTDPAMGSVAFPGGIFGASIIASNLGTADKTTMVRYFHSGFLPMEINVVIVPVADPACTPAGGGGGPPILPSVSEVASSGRTHWDVILGGKGNDTLNGSLMMREPNMGKPCIITDVFVDLLDRTGTVVATSSLGGPAAYQKYGWFGAFSYGVQLTAAMIGTSDPGVTVHWWFDVGSAVRYQVRYMAQGASCSLQ